MKCPLLYGCWIARQRVEVPELADCLKEECAWWDKVMGKCAILCLIEVNLEMNKRIGQTIRLLTSQKGI